MKQDFRSQKDPNNIGPRKNNIQRCSEYLGTQGRLDFSLASIQRSQELKELAERVKKLQTGEAQDFFLREDIYNFVSRPHGSRDFEINKEDTNLRAKLSDLCQQATKAWDENNLTEANKLISQAEELCLERLGSKTVSALQKTETKPSWGKAIRDIFDFVGWVWSSLSLQEQREQNQICVNALKIMRQEDLSHEQRSQELRKIAELAVRTFGSTHELTLQLFLSADDQNNVAILEQYLRNR